MSPTTPTIALCGAGMIARAHASAAAALGLKVVAVASRTPERASALADAIGARAVGYDDLPAGADVVVVCTPPQCHTDDAVRMLEAGAAVVLEKPLCRTLSEADRLVEAAERHGGRLLYAENLAYAPVFGRMLTLADRVGTPTHLEVRTLSPLPQWGDFTSDDWGGGALFDLGVHPLALVMLLANATGSGRPTSVRATLRGGAGHGTDEHAEVTLGFATGFSATVIASWQATQPQWDLQLAGDRGVVRAELMPTVRLEWNGDEVALAPTKVVPAVIEQFGYSGQLAAFVHDLDARRHPTMSAAVGREVLQVVMGAYRSAGTEGSTVTLPIAERDNRTPLDWWHRRGATGLTTP